MLEMASQGAKVLQTRSVEMAMKHHVRIQVRSSFEESPGTLVVDEDEIVEQALVSGIAYSRDEAKITLLKVPDQPGVAAKIFGPLAEAAINVRSEEHTSELQSLMRISYAVFCLKKKKLIPNPIIYNRYRMQYININT